MDGDGNLVTGRTNNPWNLERTPGGSSSGESAAIAAGMSPIGIGSDVAISLRGPAAFTGIAAPKATHARIPYTGHFPVVLTRWWHVGPMARTVRDVALGYSILSGPEGPMAKPSTPKLPSPAMAGSPVRHCVWAGRRIRLSDRSIPRLLPAYALSWQTHGRSRSFPLRGR